MILREAVFNILIDTLNRYEYCILRNYSMLPRYENDIDILIEAKSTNTFLDELISKFKKESVTFLYKVHFSCLAVYFYDKISDEFIHIDLFNSIKWKVFEYIPANEVLRTRIKYNNFFIPAPYYEMHELLLTRLIYQGKIKEFYKERIYQLYNKLNTVQDKNDRYNIFKYIVGKKWDKIEKNFKYIRLKIILSNFLTPLKLVKQIILFLHRIISRLFNPPGLFIAFYGVDGSGKTTQINNIILELKGIYSDKVRLFHFRPTFIYRKPENIRIINPHNQKKSTIFRSIIKLFYYLFVYNWDYYTHIIPLLSKNYLIIFDRYYFDILIDPIRYRIFKANILVKLIGHFIPKPQLNICLVGDSQKIYERKKEINSKEIINQQMRLKKVNLGDNTFFINSDDRIVYVTKEVKNVIIKIIMKKND